MSAEVRLRVENDRGQTIWAGGWGRGIVKYPPNVDLRNLPPGVVLIVEVRDLTIGGDPLTIDEGSPLEREARIFLGGRDPAVPESVYLTALLELVRARERLHKAMGRRR